MYLPGQSGDVLSPIPRSLRKAVIIMSTYEELSLIVSIALLIVAILNLTHKKWPSCSRQSLGTAILS